MALVNSNKFLVLVKDFLCDITNSFIIRPTKQNELVHAAKVNNVVRSFL